MARVTLSLPEELGWTGPETARPATRESGGSTEGTFVRWLACWANQE